MKTLTILRHAKAEPYRLDGSDFDRALAKKGKKQMKRIAPLIAQAQTPLDWVVSSPARRARETAELLVKLTGFEETIVWEERIYEATAPTLLSVLQEVPDSAEHVAIVGHNPGMEGLAGSLCASGEARTYVRLATAGVAHLAADIARWRQLRWGCAELLFVVSPRYVKKA